MALRSDGQIVRHEQAVLRRWRAILLAIRAEATVTFGHSALNIEADLDTSGRDWRAAQRILALRPR
eukprot:6551582-Pyramimonas_sp.AAC.1